MAGKYIPGHYSFSPKSVLSLDINIEKKDENSLCEKQTMESNLHLKQLSR